MSRSIDFFPRSSDHFLEALVKAFFLLLYLFQTKIVYCTLDHLKQLKLLQIQVWRCLIV